MSFLNEMVARGAALGFSQAQMQEVVQKAESNSGLMSELQSIHAALPKTPPVKPAEPEPLDSNKQVRAANPISTMHSANPRMAEHTEVAKVIADFKPQRVYHGSAVRNLEKIGFELPKAETGVQVFGTGIYFSQSKEVAEEFYRRGKELGDLYEANIPHDNYLLDYNKSFTEQSDYVKKALLSHPAFKEHIDAQLGSGNDVDGLRFQEMADISTTKYMSDDVEKAARSKLLSSLGIKGNRHVYLVKDGAGKEIIADAFAIYDPRDITNVVGTKEAPTAEKIAQHALDSKPKAQVDEWSDFLGEDVSDLFAPKKPLDASQVKPVNPILEAHSANKRIPVTNLDAPSRMQIGTQVKPANPIPEAHSANAKMTPPSLEGMSLVDDGNGVISMRRTPPPAEPQGPPRATLTQQIEMRQEREKTAIDLAEAESKARLEQRRLQVEQDKAARAAEQKVEPTPKKVSKATPAATSTPVPQSAPQGKPQVKPAAVKPVVAPTQTPAKNPIPKQHSANKPMGQAARSVPIPPAPSANKSMAQGSRSWSAAMQGATMHALDIETTSTQAGRAKIYNIGVSQFSGSDFNTVKSQDYFISGLVDHSSAISVEDQMLALHDTPNSLKFAEAQKERGVFQTFANASEYTTVDKAVQSFADNIAGTSGKKFIIGQNLNFENKMFEAAMRTTGDQSLSKETVAAYNVAAGRTGHHLSANHMFKEYKAIEDLKNGKTNPATTTGFFNTFKHMLATKEEHTQAEMHKALGNYSAAYDNVMDKYKELMHLSATTGNAPVVDLMDVTRAVYARAALAGDLNPELINHGSSISFLLKGLIDESREEGHLGGSDNTDAKDIFKVLAEEHDAYSADPTYRSDRLQNINRRFIETNEIHQSYLRGMSNTLEESANKSKSLKTFITKARLATKESLSSYAHINTGRGARVSIHSAVSSALDSMPDTVTTVADARKHLEEILKSSGEAHEAASKVAEVSSKSVAGDLKAKLLNKKMLIGAGVLVAANMIFSSPPKNTNEYNTYDELYNNQYYGTQFADWQERNKHGKMIY